MMKKSHCSMGQYNLKSMQHGCSMGQYNLSQGSMVVAWVNIIQVKAAWLQHMGQYNLSQGSMGQYNLNQCSMGQYNVSQCSIWVNII